MTPLAALRSVRVRDRFRAMGPRLLALLFAAPFYPLTLRGPTFARGKPPEPPRLIPADPWPGDQALGRAVVEGRFPPFGQSDPVLMVDAGVDPWDGPAARTPVLQGFSWLRHLRALDADGGTEGTRTAARLAERWLVAHGARWSEPAWRIDVLGERVAAWLANHPLLAAGMDEDGRRALLCSLAMQTRHLVRVVGPDPERAGSMAPFEGLAAAVVALPGVGPGPDRLSRMIERAAQAQILPDGGHRSRNPALALDALARMIAIRDILLKASLEPPGALLAAVDRLVPFVRGLRHGDGGLALFGGAVEGDPLHVDQTLVLAGAKGRAIGNAPHSGYQRVRAGRSILIADGGTTGAAGHQGALSFEFSVGRQRIVVNCGSCLDSASPWHEALCRTAAHSTLTVGEADQSVPSEPPPMVTCARNQAEGDTLFELSHDGYRARHGLVHRRDLYLSSGGDDLRGRDELVGPGAGVFAIRFHLHPEVSVSLVRDGAEALLRPKGGAVWRFSMSGGILSLQDGVYMGDGVRVRRSRQIVVSGPVDGKGVVVKWALRREGRDGKGG